MDIDLERLTAFERAVLASGAHASFADGACAMEWAAHLAGEKHSDAPGCVSPVIGAFMRSWNDSLDDKNRQRLKPYIPKTLGTAASAEVENKRAWLAADWLVREYLPAWLELAKLTPNAEQLRALPEITSATITATMPALKDAQAKGSAARSAAESAARSAAESAAESAAWSAAESATRSAAESAARSAAESAARSALNPTVEKLQLSAFKLLERMIEAG